MSLMLCCRTPSTGSSFSARSATTPGWRLTKAALQPLSDERSTAFGIGEVDFGSAALIHNDRFRKAKYRGPLSGAESQKRSVDCW